MRIWYLWPHSEPVRKLTSVCLRERRNKQQISAGGPRAVAHQRDAAGVAPERRDVLLDPLQCGHLIQQAEVAHRVSCHSRLQKTCWAQKFSILKKALGTQCALWPLEGLTLCLHTRALWLTQKLCERISLKFRLRSELKSLQEGVIHGRWTYLRAKICTGEHLNLLKRLPCALMTPSRAEAGKLVRRRPWSKSQTSFSSFWRADESRFLLQYQWKHESVSKEGKVDRLFSTFALAFGHESKTYKSYANIFPLTLICTNLTIKWREKTNDESKYNKSNQLQDYFANKHLTRIC